MKYIFKEDFWGGLSYRTGKIIIVQIGARIDNHYFGYAFDFAFSDIKKSTYGSNEIMIAMKLVSNTRRYKWHARNN